jgi:hypothetical protein
MKYLIAFFVSAFIAIVLGIIDYLIPAVELKFFTGWSSASAFYWSIKHIKYKSF